MKQIKTLKNIAALTLFLLLVGAGLYFTLDADSKPLNVSADAKNFTLMTWNVDNFFDDKNDGTEYPEFILNAKGWTKEAYKIKLANITQVIKDANPDILALQEIENEDVLKALQKNLKGYEWRAITTKQGSPIQVGLLSRFYIKSVKQFGDGVRPILKVTLDINGTDFVVYANHWRAKPAPESKRVAFAQELKADITNLPTGTPYVIVGDLNEGYDECFNFKPIFNDTNGVLGIEHILQTAKSPPNEPCKLVSKADILIQSEPKLRYDAWQEVPPQDRWSEIFVKEYDSLDHIILPKSLFTDKGISYQDESFSVFKPPYLLKKGRPFRWQSAVKSGETNEGYSDHLPLIAKFSKSAFVLKTNKEQNATFITPKSSSPNNGSAKKISIASLYDKGDMSGDFLITNAVVTYRADDMAIIKERGGRAIEVYGAIKEWNIGDGVNLRFSQAKKWHGASEISKIFDSQIGSKQEVKSLYLKGSDINLSNPKYENEVIANIDGLYSKGMFYYGNNQSIKIYFKNKELKPKGMAKVKLITAPISIYDNEPQIVLRNASDWQVLSN